MKSESPLVSFADDNGTQKATAAMKFVKFVNDVNESLISFVQKAVKFGKPNPPRLLGAKQAVIILSCSSTLHQRVCLDRESD